MFPSPCPLAPSLPCAGTALPVPTPPRRPALYPVARSPSASPHHPHFPPLPSMRDLLPHHEPLPSIPPVDRASRPPWREPLPTQPWRAGNSSSSSAVSHASFHYPCAPPISVLPFTAAAPHQPPPSLFATTRQRGLWIFIWSVDLLLDIREEKWRSCRPVARLTKLVETGEYSRIYHMEVFLVDFMKELISHKYLWPTHGTLRRSRASLCRSSHKYGWHGHLQGKAKVITNFFSFEGGVYDWAPMRQKSFTSS